MVDTFSELLNRQNSLERLSKQLEDATASNLGKAQDDPRFWRPTTDKAGNGVAIIRFLPDAKGEDVPFVRVFSHSFQGPTGLWYIENCLTTIGKNDPVAEYNSQLWNSGDEASKEQVRKQKRRLSFISNVYVVKDPAAPENEGQVRLFRYGKKIYDKIKDMAHPAYEEDTPVEVFHFVKGANFRMVIHTNDGKWRNYDKSEFAPPAPLFVTKDGRPDEKRMQAVWAKQYPLHEFDAPDQFKDYSVLKAQLNRVLGITGEDEPPPFDIEKAPAKSRHAQETVEDDDSAMRLFDEMMSAN